MRLTETDIIGSLHDWMESFHSLARKRDIRLTLDAPQDGQLKLAIDPEKIERVFFNIVSNAFKHTPDNGAISVACRQDGSDIILKISDTGDGISSRDLGNIFDRFYQVDRVNPNGSGIGLSLAKAFVELHGGSISVESTEGKGSTFTVRLPIRHVEETATESEKRISESEVEAELNPIETEAVFDDGKPVLLVVDDNSDIQKLIRELLGSGYNVITASNGKEGVRMAVKYVPDLIVCDVMMPVMDGLECCRRIKTELSTSHIPVLMLTACSLDEQRIQGYDSGADGYLSKPFNTAVLKARCESLIANRKRIKELWQTKTAGGIKEKEDKPDRKALPKSDIDNEFYNRFLDILNADIGNPDLNVDKISTMMGLERSQFYRKIKALTNYSPVELIRRLRLKKARTLLTSTEKSVSEIAYEIGFSTPAYFSKCYREAYGETPTEARSKIMK